MSILSQNLKTRLDLLEMNQEQLAKKAGVSKATINRLLKGTYTRTRNLLQISSALECPPDWLMNGTESLDMPSGKASRVPLISWINSCDWTSLEQKSKDKIIEDWVEIGLKTGEHSFALRVEGDSMHSPSGLPCVPRGSIIIADPGPAAKNLDIVLAKVVNTTNVTLKQLIIEYPHKHLHSLNPTYEDIEMDQKWTIIGVVRQTLSNF